MHHVHLIVIGLSGVIEIEQSYPTDLCSCYPANNGDFFLYVAHNFYCAFQVKCVRSQSYLHLGRYGDQADQYKTCNSGEYNHSHHCMALR